MMTHTYRLAVVAGVLALFGCGGGSDGGGGGGITPPPPPPPPPPTVASVTVEPGQVTLTVGGTGSFTATARTNTGAVLAKTFAWTSTNQAVATVTQSGSVTALAPGQTTIIATADGIGGQATVTVQSAVASVTFSGSARVKVGDTYNYTATAKAADGTVLNRPVTWRVVEAERASVTGTGVLLPLSAGSITLEAVIDGEAWQAAIVAYDWIIASNATTVGAFLYADVEVTNQFGTSEYPLLTVGCSSGTFVTGVNLENFVTASGSVAYSFDGGPVITQTWIESDDFDALIHPGFTNLARKNFAQLIANSSRFGFGFVEFRGSAKATIFRVTRMNEAIASSLAACPGNGRVAGEKEITSLLQLAGVARSPERDIELRREMGPRLEVAPTLGFGAGVRELEAKRAW